MQLHDYLRYLYDFFISATKGGFAYVSRLEIKKVPANGEDFFSFETLRQKINFPDKQLLRPASTVLRIPWSH